MKNKRIIIAAIFILLPVFLIFRKVFLPGPLFGGDAPYFYSEGISELVSEPLAWTTRGINFGGGNLFISIWPIMILYAVLGSVFGNDLVVRILFYLPSILFSIFGVIFLGKYLKLSRFTIFFLTLVYTLNTYFILLIDGGQVGVALAYSLFPISLTLIKRLLEKQNINNLFLALVAIFINSIADVRVAMICLSVVIVWHFVENGFKELKAYKYFILLLVCFGSLSLFWIIPLIKNGTSALSLSVSNLQLMSILNPLLLFQPHWPGNEFGKVIQPLFYFSLIPILVFVSLIISPKRRNYIFAFLFLVFAFLTKGTTYPLGNIYELLLRLPFGFAFRDSSKFFIPVIVFGGILIGETVTALMEKTRGRLKIIWPIATYLFLVIVLYPAVLGKLNFVLSSKNYDGDFEKIYKNTKLQNGEFKTAWFSEHHPLAYETNEKQILDARSLVEGRPFADLNIGEDSLNFLNSPDYYEWFRILGIRYVVSYGNPRNVTPTMEDIKSEDAFNQLLANDARLNKVNWVTKIPVYEIKDIYPKFFAVEKIYGVLGGNINSTYPAVYFEDGKWDPKILEGKNSNALKIILNGKTETDLAMSFLQKYFVSSSESTSSEWSYYSSSDYLKYKYELLIRNVKFNDFDYGKGISLSTHVGEAIKFNINEEDNQEYVYATRLLNTKTGKFNWEFSDSKNTKTIVNEDDLKVINVVAVIPKKEFDSANQLAGVFIKHFGVENPEGKFEYEKLEISQVGTLKYRFTPQPDKYWIIFTNHFHPLWKMQKGIDSFNSFPIYSMVNGFYIEPNWSDTKIYFAGQENVRWGMYWSSLVAFILGIIFIWKKSQK